MNSVQLGVYERPLRVQNLEDNEELLAHYNMETEQRQIRLIGADQEDVIGQYLPPEETSIYELYQQQEEQKQEGEEQKKVVQEESMRYEDISNESIQAFSDCLFIPDVVMTEKNVYYFGIPKFGSQFSAKFTIKEFLNEKSFDDCLNKTQDYLQKRKEIDSQKQKDEQDFEQKVKDMEERGEDTGELAKERSGVQYEEVVMERPVEEVKDYVFVIDNQGQDKIISEQELQKLKHLVLFFQNKWTSQNLKDIKDTVSKYLLLSETYVFEKFLDNEEQILDKLSNREKELDEILQKMSERIMSKEVDMVKLGIDYVRKVNCTENHKQTEFVDYYMHEFKTLLYQEQIKENLEIIRTFIDLKYSKFQRIFQLGFYLLGKDKAEVNLLNSNLFNWRKFKESSFEEFMEGLEAYEYQGKKEGEFKTYNRVDWVDKQLQTIDQEQLKSYSYPFLLVYRVLTNLCQLRMMDIKKRRKEITLFNKIRQMKLDQKQKREELMKQEMDLAKQEFYTNLVDNEPQEKKEEAQEETPEAQEEALQEEKEKLEFNEQQWIENWTELNPEIMIPFEIPFEEDNDVSSSFFDSQEQPTEGQ